MNIRPIADDDIDSVLRLNADEVLALSPMDAVALEQHRSHAARVLVCELDEQVVAFAISYLPGADYGSINYRWHGERFADFLYLDRIAVASTARRRGIAGRLYDAMELVALEHERMVCEVNSDPPNHGSLAFHHRRGYRDIGHLRQGDGHETVMMEKPLTAQASSL